MRSRSVSLTFVSRRASRWRWPFALAMIAVPAIASSCLNPEAPAAPDRVVVYLDPDAEANLVEGVTVQLKAKALSANGNFKNVRAEWSPLNAADTQFVAVDQEGNLTLKRAGPFNVVAKVANVSVTYANTAREGVRLLVIAPDGAEIARGTYISVDVDVGTTRQLRVINQGVRVPSELVRWKITQTEDVATVDDSGRVTGKLQGSAQIEATVMASASNPTPVGRVIAYADVAAPVPVSVSITPNPGQVIVTETLELVPHAFDRGGNGIDQHITEFQCASSNTSVATVVQSADKKRCVVTGGAQSRSNPTQAYPTATITVTAVNRKGAKAQDVTVQLINTPLGSCSATATARLNVGQTATPTVSCQDIRGRAVTNLAPYGISWSSTNPAAVTVDNSATGSYRAVAPGDAWLDAQIRNEPGYADKGARTAQKVIVPGWGTVPNTGLDVNAIWGVSASRVFVATSHGGMLLYDRDNSTLAQVLPNGLGSTNFVGLLGISPDEVVAVGATLSSYFLARCQASTLRCDPFTPSPASAVPSISPSQIAGTSGSDIWVGGGFGGVVAHFDGTRWENRSLPAVAVGKGLFDLWSPNPNEVWAALEGIVCRWTGSWSCTDFKVPQNGVQVHPACRIGDCNVQLLGIWGTSTSDVYVVGTGSTILHWNGSAWTLQIPYNGAGPALTDVQGRGPNEVYATGSMGTILRWNGSAWTDISSQLSTAQRNFNTARQYLWVPPTGTDVYVGGVGNPGVLIRYQP
ncbi:MAG: Ig-like domain-containing protein [Gemmatimonadaceae bacterium]